MNLKRNALLISTAILVGLTIPSCSKYEDGPEISLRSKEARLANTWEMEHVFMDGEVVTDNYEQFQLQLLEGGYAKWVSTATFNDRTQDYESEGTWTFVHDKESVTFNFDEEALDQTFKILKLEEDALWMINETTNMEVQFEPYNE
ncbi:MAG: hypothetical protein MRY83_12760 [Flavobacteriales bacterium]|nr:hypothetical protein [Flavobacteriales bacterium]